MSFRHFFAMLFAAAMFFAPFAMPGSQATAASLASHHDGAVTADHCGDKSDQGKGDKGVDKSCCAAMCLGIAADPASPDDPPLFAAMPIQPSPDQFRRSFLGEIATPPPRVA